MSFVLENQTDNYYSNKEVWQVVKDYIPRDKVLWESFYGDGKSGQYLRELGFDVIHKDINFFDNNLGDIIISNPPFSKRRDIFTRLKKLDKPFMMVMFPIVLSCKWFLDLDMDIQVIIPKKRPKFYHLELNKKNYTPNGGTWFFCYKMNLPKDLIFI